MQRTCTFGLTNLLGLVFSISDWLLTGLGLSSVGGCGFGATLEGSETGREKRAFIYWNKASGVPIPEIDSSSFYMSKWTEFIKRTYIESYK